MTRNPLLTSELAAVREELPRVDDKCQALAKLTSAGQAAMAFLLTTAHTSALARLLLAATGVQLATAALVVLVALRPQLGHTGFRRYAAMTSPQVTALFTTPVRAHAFDPDGPFSGTATSTADGIEAEHLQVLSRIVDRKYRALRHAFTLTGFAVMFLTFALVAGVIA